MKLYALTTLLSLTFCFSNLAMNNKEYAVTLKSIDGKEYGNPEFSNYIYSGSLENAKIDLLIINNKPYTFVSHNTHLIYEKNKKQQAGFRLDVFVYKNQYFFGIEWDENGEAVISKFRERCQKNNS